MSGSINARQEDEGIPSSRPFGPNGGAPAMVEGLVNPSNVNLVGQPIATPRSWQASYRAESPRLPSRSYSWSATLVFACLALGLAGSIVQWERRQLGDEQGRAISLATANSLLAGRQEDLGKFLADPGTRLIRLISSDGSTVRKAALAWNSAEHSGFLFCDELPVLDAGVRYEIWAIGGAESPLQVADIDAMVGVSAYPFNAGNAVGAIRGWEITAGSRSAGKLPILVGTVP